MATAKIKGNIGRIGKEFGMRNIQENQVNMYLVYLMNKFSHSLSVMFYESGFIKFIKVIVQYFSILINNISFLLPYEYT